MYLHGVLVVVGGQALGQLDGGDAEGPDVGFVIVGVLTEHLGGHPEGRTDDGVALGKGGVQLSGDAEVSQFGNTIGCEKNITGLNVLGMR